MTKKIVKRTDTNNETLYFYTHSDAVDVGEGSSTKSLTEVLDDTLHKSAQTLTNAEKTQVHANLGTESFVGDRAVRYDEAQVLGSSEKTQALTNLGLNGVDEVPTENSNNVVRSGGVYEELALGTVYDVSAKNPTAGPNNDGKWESLSALLSDANLNTLIPLAVRKGGMSIRFIQGSVPSSDNKYVQYMLMSSTFTTIISAWQEINNTLLSQTLFGVTNAINLLSSTGGTVIANYLTIKQGQKLYYKITGTTSASRIILRYNENDAAHNILDGIKVGQQYTFTAPADISKIYIWTNGSLTGNIELKFGFINELNLDIENLNNDVYGCNLSNSMGFVKGTDVRLLTTDLIAGMTYNYGVSVSSELGSQLAFQLKDSNGNVIKTGYLNTPDTSIQLSYIADNNYKDAYLCYRYQYDYATFTEGTIITGSIVSIGLAKSVKENAASIDDLNKKVIYCRHKVSTINDISNYNDIVNGDYIIMVSKIVKVTDVSSLPSSGYVWADELLKQDSLYIADGCVYIYDGTIFKPDYTQIAVISESTNLYDASSVINGIIKQDGTYSNDANTYSVTDYIPVSNGETLIGWWDKGNEFGYFTKPKFRFVCAYNALKRPLSNYGAEEVREYTVSNAAIAFIRITLYRTDISKTGFRINKGSVKPYEDYFYGMAPLWGIKTKQDVASLLREPYKTLPEDVVNTMSYKRLGGLEHGYIILTTDDGREGLAEYTVPMIINKGVPCSFCIMSDSVVMRDENPTMKAAVLDAVTNHNCEIVQHGANRWCEKTVDDVFYEGYKEWELRDFFAREKAFWDNLGITVKAAAVPEHTINNTVKAVAGGLYGVCRCGYDKGTKYYDYYCNGPKSNMYALSSRNVMDNDLDNHKAAIDYAIAHHYIYILYWHEIDLNETQKQKLEAVIDYAKTTDIVFAKLGDVPDLV